MSGYNIKAIDAELECLNERIAERDATIASQAAQIERLRKAITDEDGEMEIRRLRMQINDTYGERDRLVCALSKVFPSWLERHPLTDTSWDDDWRWIVFINFPTGQGSWHIHESEHPWFSHLEFKAGNSWDGHTNDQKYDRLAALQPEKDAV
jgi:uncharacterized coiled-coil protein SlyX